MVTHEVVVSLIVGTTNASGLKVRARLDTKRYPTGAKATAAEWQQLSLHPKPFHGE